MNHIALMTCMLLSAGAAPAYAAEPAPTTSAAPASATSPISQAALLSRVAKKEPGLVVLDVRTPAEFAAGHVPGARNVPHDEIPARLAELSSLKDQQVVLYCRSGRRTAIAAETLRGAGFEKLLHLEGDWLAWEAAKQPVER
jgi:rhodanese-related sulfurtransferase